MEIFVYVLLLSMMLISWVWSNFVQTTTESVQLTERVGSTLTWLVLTESILGLIVIVYGNFTEVNTWKVYMLLIIVMAIVLVMFWITYQYVEVIVSRKVPKKDVKEEDYTRLISVILISVALLLGVTLKRDLNLTIIVYLVTPIILLGERFYSVQKKRKEYDKYPKVSVEDIKKAEEALIEKIDKGLEFKVRDTFLQRKLDKQRDKTKEIIKYTESVSKKDDKKEGGDS